MALRRQHAYGIASWSCLQLRRSPIHRGSRALPLCLVSTLLVLSALFALLLPPSACGGTPPDTPIVNQASASYGYAGLELSSLSNVDSFLVSDSPAKPAIKLYRYAPDNAELSTTVPVTSYSSGSASGALIGIPAPRDPGAPTPLHEEIYFHAGQPIYLVVSAARQNLSAESAQSVTVEITSSTGDQELLTLTETGPDTGIFAGYILAAQKSGGPVRYDGTLTVADAARVLARYHDSADAADAVEASALVDPTGRLFDSVTGQPVDGVTVILSYDNGSVAPVLGDDGVSDYPDRVTSGGTASDQGGRSYDFAPGAYRFPLLATGSYRLSVQIPPGSNYRFPSTRSDADLALLAGAPYALSPASRGASFEVNPGPIIRIDIPLDPIATGLWLQKHSGKTTAALGDFVPFSVGVSNTSQAAITGIVMTDRLPAGLRYQPGSLRLAGVAAPDPAVSSDGATLSFPVGDLAPAELVGISYVTRVIPGARPGTISNEVSATGRNVSADVTSNLATASLKITEDLFASRAFLMGSVTEGACGSEGSGLKGVRIYLEDGSFVVTDKRGMFHFEGVLPGSHVAQLDLQSLPAGYRVVACQQNSRFAGRPFSQFVDLQGGSMWRVDFQVEREAPEKVPRVKPAPAPAPAPAPPPPAPAPVIPVPPEPAPPEPVVEETIHSEAGIALRSVVQGESVTYQALLGGGPAPLSRLRLTVQLPAGVSYIPGSCDLEGIPVADPDRDGDKLSFALPDSSGEWESIITLRASLNRKVRAGGQLTSALLSFDTPRGDRLSTPPAMNLLDLDRKENRIALPEIVLHPQFPTFSADLIPEDKDKLDRLAATLSEVTIAQITVTGHTDSVRISARGKSTYRDNKALSLARANSIGQYLMKKLQLPPEMLKVAGMGESEPATSNKTEKGRALNRRVEIRVLAERRTETTLFKQVKDDSGMLKTSFSTVQRRRPPPKPAAAELPVQADATAGDKPAGQGVPAGESALSGAGSVLWAVAGAGAAAVQAVTGLDAGAPVAGATAAGAAAAKAAPEAEVLSHTEPTISHADRALSDADRAETDAAPDADSGEAEALETTETEQGEDDEQVPVFDQAWLENSEQGRDWAWPPAVYFPAITSTHIAVMHHPTDKVSLSVNGEPVHPVLLEKVLKNPSGSSGLSYWRGVPLKYGDNRLVAVLLQAGGEKTVLERVVHVSTAPVKAELVPELSRLVADGKTPPVIALRLLDKDDAPARSGVAGKFSVASPYQPFRKLADNMGNDPLEKNGVQYLVGKEGVALIRLQPTSRSGEVQLTVPLNERDEQYRVWLTPEQRDWILVGIGEGTFGYRAISGKMTPVSADAPEESLYQDGRLALFAKGTIQGKWLLTLAFDSAKGKPAVGEGLFQTIDPDSYYTLYGDASQQQNEAASTDKLYLKIERDRFYALFGDYDTGLTVTELSRYSRTLNGLKSEYQGENLEFKLFGSNTGQLFVKDELRGDGTSGLYRLTRREIALSSEKVRIETRDRYRSEIVLASTTLARFADYTIDYDAGTIFFKAPVSSTDSQFNPVYIVIDYETENRGADSLTLGGRVGAKFRDDNVKGGLSYIHEGQLNAHGDLFGVDLLWQINRELRVRGEAAGSGTDFAGVRRSGSSYLAELEQRSTELNARLYFRELGEGFGLGQQSATEEGTRKLGVDASYKIKERFTLNEQAYRQYNLATGAVSNVVEAKGIYTAEQYGLSLGGRYASDLLEDGSSKSSQQLIAGANWLTLNKKLNLHVDHDQSLGQNGNVSFPTRTAFGADYKITPKLVLSGQQEFSSGDAGSSSNTSVGLKSTLWEGGAAHTGMQRNLNENGERLFALFGLKQLWKLNDKWSVDGGLDRSQTVKGSQSYSVNANAAPAVGSSEDFTALSLGASYQEKMWSASSRVETRIADSENKRGVLTSLVGELAPGWGGSSRLRFYHSDAASGEKKSSGELRLGLAYRPVAQRWILLDRLDLILEQDRGGEATVDMDSRRIVNNLIANCKPYQRLQLSLQYGAKYAFEAIDHADYSGYTDLIGFEGRYDLTKSWDLGFRASIMHAWGSGQYAYSAGPSVGVNVVENAWISLGYNLVGFSDKDFSAADYTARGPFLRFRFKFDQNSVKDAAAWMNRQ
ncbi:MAG: hypothetical protein A2075_01155 [Geobacteraceae bacterium GWC2_58_44]|nr:MAG: hypothetical protein A2075_01155 [Geobacteraceae bacterium GWC2_58_44]HBG04140.1 hypothetical protein [Geobacter sp.]